MSREISIEDLESKQKASNHRANKVHTRVKRSSARALIDTNHPDFAWQCFLLSGVLCWMVATLILVL